MTFLENRLFAKPFNWSHANGTVVAGSLASAGAGKVITFSALPQGIVVGNYVYISGGSGTAEAALVTAVSGTARGAGSITVTTGNAHNGAWTVSSASGGFQEAWNTIPSGTGCIDLSTTDTIQIHAKVIAPSGRSVVDGGNFYNYALQRASDYPNGHLIDFPASAIVTMQNMWIQNSTYPTAQSSGAGLHYQAGSNATLKNIMVLGGYIGYDFDGTSSLLWDSSSFTADANTLTGALIHDSGGLNPPTNSQLNGGFFSLLPTTDGLTINGVDLIQITNISFGNGKRQIFLNRTGLGYISGVYINTCSFDNATINAIKMQGTGTFQGVHINGGGGGGNPATSGHGIDAGYTDLIALNGLTINGILLAGFGQSGIGIGAVKNVTVTGVKMIANNTLNGSDGGIKLDTTANCVDISGCIVTDVSSFNAAPGHSAWGVGTIGVNNKLTIVGNDFSGAANAFSFGGVPTNSTIESNTGHSIPVFANNGAAVAGGLWVGAKYRTGADPDVVCTVH